MTRKLPLSSVQKKGRWRTLSSVTRYEKSARLVKEVNALPKETMTYFEKTEKRLCRILAGKEAAPTPPFQTHRRLRGGRSLPHVAWEATPFW